MLAGSLTLVAMSLSFAESVLASVCAPEGSMADMPGMPAETMNMDGSVPGEMPGMPMPASDDTSEEEGGRASECPLGPALGQGCSSLASLPAAQAGADSPARMAPRRIDVDDVRADLLLTHGLFRPPRA
jgi:hypothetical protein